MKKNTFRDKLKTWLYTLCIGGFACLLGFGASMTEKYTKASAYEYQNNGTLIFTNDEKLQLSNFIFHSMPSRGVGTDEIEYSFEGSYLVKYNNDYYQFNDLNLTTSGGEFNILYFSNTEGDNYISYIWDTDYWLYDEGVIVDDSVVANLVQSFEFQPYGSDYYTLLNYSLSYNVPQNTGNFLTALSDFAQLMVGGIIDLGTGLATGITSMASALFLDSGNLSVMGGIIAMFCGLALAVGITTKVYTWVTTLGN